MESKKKRKNSNDSSMYSRISTYRRTQDQKFADKVIDAQIISQIPFSVNEASMSKNIGMHLAEYDLISPSNCNLSLNNSNHNLVNQFTKNNSFSDYKLS